LYDQFQTTHHPKGL